MIGDIVAALIRLFAETPEDAADRADYNLGQAAAQTLDSLIKHQPPRHTVPHVIREVQARSASAASSERNAAMMAISVTRRPAPPRAAASRAWANGLRPRSRTAAAAAAAATFARR